jgi:hypothetical protein
MVGERVGGKKMGEGKKIEEILKDGSRESRRKEKGGKEKRKGRDREI